MAQRSNCHTIVYTCTRDIYRKGEGRTLLDGRCSIRLREDGSFSVLSEDERVYAAVNRYYEGPARASVSADNNYFKNGGEFGEVEQSGACWSNATFEICAWR